MRVICIASGPSLTQEDVDYCRGKGKVYVVNDVYKIAPWADILYACDKSWWDHHNGAPDFKGEKWTLTDTAAKAYNLNWINCIFGRDWSNDPNFIAGGGNSGFQCLNLAVIQNPGAEFFLLGYDMQARDQNKKHFFGNHPKGLDRGSNYTGWVKNFIRASAQINEKVVNCTVDTAVPCFERKPLREAL